MKRRHHGGSARCECPGTCNREHSGQCPNTAGALAAGSRYPVRLTLVDGRVLCVGCLEPFDPNKRWAY